MCIVHNRGGMCPLCGLYGIHAHTCPEIDRLRQEITETLESWWLADA